MIKIYGDWDTLMLKKMIDWFLIKNFRSLPPTPHHRMLTTLSLHLSTRSILQLTDIQWLNLSSERNRCKRRQTDLIIKVFFVFVLGRCESLYLRLPFAADVTRSFFFLKFKLYKANSFLLLFNKTLQQVAGKWWKADTKRDADKVKQLFSQLPYKEFWAKWTDK